MLETSIVIRSFNEEKHIGRVLEAVHSQDHRADEVILVDSGSTDNTVEIARRYCKEIVRIQSRDFTFGYSLNVGCKHARGRNIVILSAHAIPTDDQWLKHLVRGLSDESVAMVYGRHVGAPETKFSERRDFEATFGLDRTKGRKTTVYANNANAAIPRSLWDEHHFDEYLTGLEDIAWAKYFVDRGYRVVYEPDAAVYHIHEESSHQVFNRYRREAVAAREIGLESPPHGSWMLRHCVRLILSDCIAAGPRISGSLLNEIIQFRSHQWRGARTGWWQGVDLQKERNDLFFSGMNQAVVISGKHQAQLQEMPMPELKPGDALIKVAYVGVCRTDIEIFDRELGYYKNGHGRYPIVPGHEFCGQVVAVGANSNDIAIGDRVVGECILPCGACAPCRAGKPNRCANRSEIGVVNHHGAYARFIAMPARYIHKPPQCLDTKTACLAEPLAVVHKGLSRIAGRMQAANTRCAVIGAGPIGNLCAQALSLMGCSVTAFDRNATRLEGLTNHVRTLTTLDGLNEFDVIVEATGQTPVLNHVLDTSCTDATILLLGFPYGDFNYNFEGVVAHDRVIIGSVGSSSENFRWALQTLPKLNVTRFTETILSMHQFPQAWDLVKSGKSFKVLLKIGNEEAE